MYTKMNAIGAYWFCGLALLTTTALPVQKEVISTRLVTRWEFEFVSLNLAATASEFPCPAKDSLPDLPSLFLVTRYEIPKRRVGIMRLGVKQPKLDCESGSISLGDDDSRSLMTILAVSDQTCLSETDLRLYINIGAKDESTSSAIFHTTVYPEQTRIEWKEKFLLDDTGNSILRIKWRVSCQHHIPENRQRLKRQIPDGAANGTDDGDISITTNGTTPKPSLENTDAPNVTSSVSTASSVVENSTESIANNSQTGQDTDAGGSGEPPDSFATGISETFGFTKTSEPSKEVTNLSNELGTSAKAVVVQNLNMSDFGNSTSSTSSVYEATFTPVIPNSGDLIEDNLIKQTSSDINAPAAGDGETTDSSTKHSSIKTTTTSKPTLRPRPGDRENQRTTTTTTTTQSTTSIKPSISSSTANSLPDTIPADREDKETTTTAQSTPSNKSSTTSTTTKISRKTRPVDRQDLKTTKPISTSKQPNKVANGDDSTSTTKKFTSTPSTSIPKTSPPPASEKADTTSSTTTTTAAIVPSTPKTSPITKRPRPGDKDPIPISTTTTRAPRKTRPGDLNLETPAIKTTSTTPSSTKKDVIFTAPKPSPTYPDTSNEPYIGKTGETSSAGWVDKGPNQIADDGADEATIWPIVMGLVVGIPTIIVIAIAITVFQKKLPQRTMSPSGGYFERRPPQMPFVANKPPSPRYSIEGPPTDIDV